MILLYVSVLSCALSSASAQFFASISEFSVRETGNNSLFGYSISYQENIQSLVASAPTAGFLGKIYKCDVKVMNGNCSIIPLKDSNKITEKYANSNYWLGASVASGSTFSIACAPRFLRVEEYRRGPRVGTFGECFISDGNYLSRMLEITQKDRLQETHGLFEETTDATGWSAVVTGDGVALVGSPAMISGRVVIYEKPRSQLNPAMVHGKNRKNSKYDVKHNFGYSVVSGNFTGAGTLYAIGSTYGVKGEGKVIFINKKDYSIAGSLSNEHTAVGSMFAACLCAGHFQGLKTQQDLVVGAPAFADLSNEYDVGAIVYYYFDRAGPKPEFMGRVIKGFKSGSRFGSAIVNLGDITGDQKDDLAVAAPYEDDHGVVYIYSGADINSVKTVGYLDKIPAGSMQTFGLSLAVVKREFRCDDLAIGAPVSERVALVLCIPKIFISISVEHNDLTIRKDEQFFEFRSCVEVQYPRPLKNISAHLQVNVEILHKTAKLRDSPAVPLLYNVTLLVNETKYCRPIVVLTPLDGDYSEVIQFMIAAKHVDDALQLNYDPSRVTVGKITPLRGVLWAATKCKSVGVCKPILEPRVEATLPDNYTVGSTDKEQMAVYVRNIGDTAYAACLQISIKGVGVLSAPSSCEGSDGMFTCRPLHPLYENDIWSTGAFDLETKGLTSSVKKIVVNVDTQCTERNDGIKLPPKEFYLSYNTNITLEGMTNRGSVIKMSKYEINEAGKDFQHIYTILNNGVTTWTGLKCTIELNNGAYVTYFDIKVVMAQQEELAHCVFKSAMATCALPELSPTDVMQIFVPMEIRAGDLGFLLNYKNLTVNSTLFVHLNGVEKSFSVSTLLTLDKATVPWWIIVLAILLGSLLLVLIGYILYQRGLLRSKKKEKLRRVRRSVRRQTIIRNSIRHSELRESFQRASTSEPLEVDFKIE